MHKNILGPVLLILSLAATLCNSLPLSTRSRWIVDEPTGARVKLVCINWAAHLKPMLPEGLDKKPVAEIARHVSQMGFNCVRLTWATYMFTRYADLTVTQSLRRLGLQDAIDGIARNNPGLLNVSIVGAQRAVIDELGRNGVMVELDNQVSKPMWCCSDEDGNGFFGDKYFDASEWLRGLAIVAKNYKDTPTVVAMSLRNELRGPLQNVTTWYNYVEKGARTIHDANPNALIVISGLDYDLSFSFLSQRPLNLQHLNNKLVYEVHRYAFTSGQTRLWQNQPFTRVCEMITEGIERQAGFLLEGDDQNAVAPLFVSEFGVDLVAENRAESLFLGCFSAYLAKMDLDWSIWALQGSYYLRNGIKGAAEWYGLLDSNWTSIQNVGFFQKLQLIQQQLNDPKSHDPRYSILYHPSSGRCIRADKSEVHATDCLGYSRWNYENDGPNPIRLIGTGLCLSSGGEGNPVFLSQDCSQWELINSSKFQVATRDEHGQYLCLDWDPKYSARVYTNKCVCFGQDENSEICQQSPQSQWFKLILANAR